MHGEQQALKKTLTVFTRFVARALIFFNLTHCRAPIQTGAKLPQKLSLKTNISRHLIFLHMRAVINTTCYVINAIYAIGRLRR